MKTYTLKALPIIIFSFSFALCTDAWSMEETPAEATRLLVQSDTSFCCCFPFVCCSQKKEEQKEKGISGKKGYAYLREEAIPNNIQRTIPLVAHGYENLYQRFLNGILIYQPKEGKAVERIHLPIAALENPLEGTFDLSRCGDASRYLRISTGYRKEKKAGYAGKLEVWFTPRFLIEKELKTTASHFQKIYDQWNDSAPVGIFWTWGGWDSSNVWCDYLTTQSMDKLSRINLHENWKERHTHCDPAIHYNMFGSTSELFRACGHLACFRLIL
jgi:hypothetical protein